MSGASKGFSLIEIMVVIVIIGTMAALFVPTFFQRRGAQSVVQTFATDLNALMQVGTLDAMRTSRLHRVVFDFKASRVALEVAQKADVDPTNTTTDFGPVLSAAAKTVIDIPDNELLMVKHFFVGKKDEGTRGENKKVWFFIGPDGSVQDVSLVLVDVERNETVTLMTNPFSGQLVMYEGLQKP